MNSQPPPLHPPTTGTNITLSPAEKKAQIYSWTAMLLAALGILPLLIYVLAALDGFGLGVLVCLIFGLVAHASGILLGFLALLSGNKISGIVGMIGNGMIAAIALLAFMFSLGLNRY